MKKQESYAQNRMVGQKLAQIRRQQGISQLAAAEALGTTQSNISQFEHGKRRISSSVVIQLCRIYNASPSEIFGTAGLPSDIPPGLADGLLRELAETSGSSELSFAADAYIYIAAYRMLRTLYETNPHNSSELFSLSSEDALKATEEFLREEPMRAAAALEPSERSSIELPVEKAQELRNFIACCEEIIRGNKRCII
ncbi:MAG: helix-turn-helix transcriptional regulator [Ruminococcus sp.]|nr:helix-turn-helix transcriptional regulator [Ruminococcus sp.]